MGAKTKSRAGSPRRAPCEFGLRTASALQFLRGFPANGTKDVESEPTITVIFNRPVVALGTAEDMAKLPSPIVISPDAQGQGEWTGTSVYSFKPTVALHGGTKYSITVKKGLTDGTGTTLQNDVTFGFTVAYPKAVDITVNRPNEQYFDSNSRYENVRRDAEISITYRQPMDTTATEAAFTLAAGASKADGDFAWNEKKTT